VRMALAMRDKVAGLQDGWRSKGREIGLGIGMAQGYATLGEIGFAERTDYTATGAVCNMAARLCAEAKDGEILIGPRIAAALDNAISLEAIGEICLKGISRPVTAYNIVGTQLPRTGADDSSHPVPRNSWVESARLVRHARRSAA